MLSAQIAEVKIKIRVRISIGISKGGALYSSNSSDCRHKVVMRIFFTLVSIGSLIVFLPLSAYTQTGFNTEKRPALLNNALLPVEQAFIAEAYSENSLIHIRWLIADGYYMYKKQFGVVSNDQSIDDLSLPTGEMIYDPFFDEDVEIYRQETSMSFSLLQPDRFFVRFQGCADAGFCYPPSWLAFNLNAETTAISPQGLSAGPAAEPLKYDQPSNISWGIWMIGMALFGCAVALVARLHKKKSI